MFERSFATLLIAKTVGFGSSLNVEILGRRVALVEAGSKGSSAPGFLDHRVWNILCLAFAVKSCLQTQRVEEIYSIPILAFYLVEAMRQTMWKVARKASPWNQ